VRNHGLTKDDNAGFFDASLWESVKRSGPAALKRLINDGLENTSVTCVLIGSETYVRPWVTSTPRIDVFAASCAAH
jgi:hypothetical protein